MESKTLYGLKKVAKYLDVSPAKVRELIKEGMPHRREAGGMYVCHSELIDDWHRDIMVSKKRTKK